MSQNEDLIKLYSGIFGHQVILKNRKGKIVMIIPKLKPKVPPSEKQLAQRERLKQGARYANYVLETPALFAEYSAKAGKGQSVYRIALNDFLKPPYIRKIDNSGYHGNIGDRIIVVAGDYFKVTSVTVKIYGEEGKVIEEGACVQRMPTGNYEYIATVQIPEQDCKGILASVTDLPGNVTSFAVGEILTEGRDGKV